MREPLENIRKFTTTHDKNRMEFHTFIEKVKIEDKEQENKDFQPTE